MLESFRRISDKLPLPLIVVDVTGRVLALNESARNQPSLDDLEEGSTLDDGSGDGGFTDFLCAAVRSNSAVPGTFVRALGQRRHRVRCMGSRFIGHDSAATEAVLIQVRSGDGAFSRLTEHIVALDAEIARRHDAEVKTLRLQEQLIARGQLETLGRLAAAVAHDLNNLLGAVLANVDVARMDPALGDLGRRALDDAATTIEHTSHFTGQILGYSGRSGVGREQLVLSDLLEDMRPVLVTALQGRGTLELVVPRGMPAIEVDVTQLRQVVLNLVMNAADSLTEPGQHVRVSASQQRIDPAELEEGVAGPNARAGMHVVLEVADNGTGMTERVRNRVFEPFFTTKTTGRGMGLAAVLEAAQAHGGMVSVCSELGNGTTFRVMLPSSDGERTATGTTTSMALAGGASGPGLAVVVDDDEHVRAS